MLLFKKAFFAGLTSGAITLTYRRWERPHVKPGGRYRCHPIGVLQVDSIERVKVRTIRSADAVAAGFPDRAALLAYLRELGPLTEASEVFRVALHHGGDGDRVELALDEVVSAEAAAVIAARLAKWDAAAPRAWTAETLAIIGAQPRIAASKLAAQLGRETLPFKEDVRRLKKLGLTQSFEVGYEVSPRGRAYLSVTPVPATPAAPAVTAAPPAPPAPKRARARRAPI